ncbi:MAG: hypothetical protein ACTSPI_15960, partial [Candidatus Heimdallarchaeaceae archaeon]
MTEITEEYLHGIAKKYEIEYTENKQKFVSSLAIKGQFFLNSNEIEEAEEISAILFTLADEWKDKLILMKYYLFLGQIALKREEDPLPYLFKALKIASKKRFVDIEVGIRVQIAFEQFRRREYKSALKHIKKVEKITKELEEPLPMV